MAATAHRFSVGPWRLSSGADPFGLPVRSADPARVGVLIETAHAILAALDPSNGMGFAPVAGRLTTRPHAA